MLPNKLHGCRTPTTQRKPPSRVMAHRTLFSDFARRLDRSVQQAKAPTNRLQKRGLFLGSTVGLSIGETAGTLIQANSSFASVAAVQDWDSRHEIGTATDSEMHLP